MLERTAATLETCSFQKVLPTASRSSLASRRRLHTAFWNHGATDFELLDACRSLILQPNLDPDTDRQHKKSTRKPNPMTPSTFLLDFLCPTAALNFFQRSRLTLYHRVELSRSLAIPARLFSSLPDTGDSDSALPQDRPECAELGGPLGQEVDAGLLSSQRDSGTDLAVLHSSAERLEEDLGSGPSPRQIVRDTLASGGKSYDLLWDEYSRLEPSEQNEFSAAMLVHLSDSHRIEDIGRVLDLFSELDNTNWTPEVVDAVIKIRLSLDDKPAAFDISKAALSEHGIGSGIDLLLTFGLSGGHWDFVSQVLELNSSKPDTSKAFKFVQLAAMPDFQQRIAELRQRLEEQDSQATATDLAGQLSILFKDITKGSLTLFRPADADFILQQAPDIPAYESYIMNCAGEGRNEQAGKLYKRYRKLPMARPSIGMLRAMIHAFYPLDFRGLEDVMEDWYQGYGHMDEFAYGKVAASYASNGEVEAVAFVTKEWAKYHPEAVEANPQRWVASQMEVHAVKGDTRKTKQVLDEKIGELGMQPTTRLWNIWLKAYDRAGDYEGCIDAFSHICEVANPNYATFGTVMSMAAYRGDLDFVCELYSLAVEKGVRIVTKLARCVVEAYCQNDQFSKAEEVCHRATQNRSIRGSRVILWNTMLRHFADRRDLARLYHTMEIMNQYRIPYDDHTYLHLLRGLGKCRQAHHALKLFRSSQEQGIFKPTAKHYLYLMDAFIETREVLKAVRIGEELKSMNFPDTPMLLDRFIEAVAMWSKMPPWAIRYKTVDGALSSALERFYSLARVTIPKTSRDTDLNIMMYSRMLFVLTLNGGFTEIPKILDLYDHQLGARKGPEAFPRRLLDNILLTELYQKRYKDAMRTWELILERTIDEGSLAVPNLESTGEPAKDSQGVFPSHRFRLSDPLKTMQRLYLALGDADGLMALVARVRREGFELDSKNWNIYVQILASLKRWREAFNACEEHLMPNWAGWRARRRTRLPLELRRLGNDPRRPRPHAYTLLVLAREYKAVMKEGLWARDVGLLWEDLATECPRTVHAVNTLSLSGSARDREIFAEKEDDLDPEMGVHDGSLEESETERKYRLQAEKAVLQSRMEEAVREQVAVKRRAAALREEAVTRRELFLERKKSLPSEETLPGQETLRKQEAEQRTEEISRSEGALPREDPEQRNPEQEGWVAGKQTLNTMAESWGNDGGSETNDDEAWVTDGEEVATEPRQKEHHRKEAHDLKETKEPSPSTLLLGRKVEASADHVVPPSWMIWEDVLEASPISDRWREKWEEDFKQELRNQREQAVLDGIVVEQPPPKPPTPEPTPEERKAFLKEKKKKAEKNRYRAEKRKKQRMKKKEEMELEEKAGREVNLEDILWKRS